MIAEKMVTWYRLTAFTMLCGAAGLAIRLYMPG